MFSLAAIAVAREGSETVVFLTSLASGDQGWASRPFWMALVLGLLLAGATFYLLQLGGRWISWRAFFRVTEAMLLMLGCALLISGVEKLIDLQTLPPLVSQLWDSSSWLDDGSVFGSMVSAFTGYRARPSVTVALAFAFYWAAVLGLERPKTRPNTAAA